MNKAYIDYNGVEYYDYDIYFSGSSSNNNTDYSFICGGTLNKILNKIRSLKDNPVFVPSKGDEICIIPDCKYNIEDIRRNYKIKRGYDHGTCNVFSENSVSKNSSYSSYCIAIIPSKKTVVANLYTQANLKADALSLFPDLSTNDIIIMSRTINNNNYYYYPLHKMKVSDAYIKLLTGTLAKPAVHIDSLDLNTGEQLTVDTLEIVHKLCAEQVNCYSDGWDEKLKLQLSALNGFDWRKYPGTINVLFNGFSYYGISAYSQMRSCSSRYPKNIKVLLTFHSDKFASQEDMDLACAFLRRIMGLEGAEFTTMKDIWDNLTNNQIYKETFLRLFDNMVRFKDKKWKDE